ncbi:hypothetical protein ACLOJK_027231 [Asimina triloba]
MHLSSRSQNCRDRTQRTLEISPPSSPASPVPSIDADDRARHHDKGLYRTIQAAHHDDHREDDIFTVRLQPTTPASDTSHDVVSAYPDRHRTSRRHEPFPPPRSLATTSSRAPSRRQHAGMSAWACLAHSKPQRRPTSSALKTSSRLQYPLPQCSIKFSINKCIRAEGKSIRIQIRFLV